MVLMVLSGIFMASGGSLDIHFDQISKVYKLENQISSLERDIAILESGCPEVKCKEPASVWIWTVMGFLIYAGGLVFWFYMDKKTKKERESLENDIAAFERKKARAESLRAKTYNPKRRK
jgi:hypothetical protein